MLDKDSSDIVGFLGSVGDDYCGDLYSDLLQKEGIIPYFERIPKQNTGTCLVLCNHNDRAHITDLGASTSITEDYIKRVLPKFEDAILIFTELFIIKTQKDLVYKIAKMGLPDHKIYGFNLPSFYFLETFQNDIQELISYADILFANIDEAKFFCLKMGIDIKQSMEKICQRKTRIRTESLLLPLVRNQLGFVIIVLKRIKSNGVKVMKQITYQII